VNATIRAPKGSVKPVTDQVDAMVARALEGRASFAETMVLLAFASAELRRSDDRIRGEK
jgi:hypothetical protein